MIITIASGKGGTGKTTVSTNLALVVSQETDVQFIDCDVEEPNAHIFLKPVFEESQTVSVPVPEINEPNCTHCGRCAQVCAFNALAVAKGNVLVFAELCHGCGACAYLCPEKAITEIPRGIGVQEKGTAHGMNFLHGQLNPGEAMSPPLINALKGVIEQQKTVIIDAPPGTSCPVVTTIKDSDLCLLVTEPTPFGLHDLALSVQLLEKLNVPAAVLINRSDIGDNRVEEFCRQRGVPVLMQLPFDKELAMLYARGEPAVLHHSSWHKQFKALGEQIIAAVGRRKKEQDEGNYGN